MRWLPENCLETISLTIVLDPIIFPAYFNVNGIITSSALLVISAIIVLHSSKIYSSMMTKKRKNLDDIIGYYLGKKWRVAYLILTLVYILQLVQVYSLYISEFIKDFMVSLTSISSESFQIKILTIVISFPIIFCALMQNSTKTFKYGLRFNVLLILSFAVIYLYIFLSSYSEIMDNFDRQLITKLNIDNLPYFLSQNNYSFHFQIYLQELLVFNQKGQIINKKIQHITIIFALLIGIFFGTVGSLIVNDKDNLSKNKDDHQNQMYNLLIFQYIQQYSKIIICMKIFIILNMLCSIGFKYIIFRQNLIKFIVDKKYILNFNRSHFDLIIKLITTIFLIVLNLSTTNQQSSFFIIVGSVTCFFILYHIPHYLKRSPKQYIFRYKLKNIIKKREYKQKLSTNQMNLSFKPIQINSDVNSSCIQQSLLGEFDIGDSKKFYKNCNTQKFQEKISKEYEIEVKQNLNAYFQQFKYLIGLVVIIYGLSSLIVEACQFS